MSSRFVLRSQSFQPSTFKVGDYLFGKILTQADIEALAPTPSPSQPYRLPADLAKRTRQRIEARKRTGSRRITGMSDGGNA